MNFNMTLDDDIAAVVDEERKNIFPKRARTRHIEAILYEHYKDKVDALKAARREQNATAQVDPRDASAASALG